MKTILLGLLLACGLAAQTPNVLLIVADDLGVDYVGAYNEGTNPPPTPTIDGLANNGVLFRNAWANPSCSPSRACILTGRYPFRTMVGRWIGHHTNPQVIGLLQPAERTIPEILNVAGGVYSHAMIGKWHLHDSFHPNDVPRTIGGFSHFAGSLEGQIPDYNNWTRVEDGVATPTSNYCTTQNTDDALTWIQNQSGPWFCALTYQAPHIPYHAPPAHLHRQNLSGLTPLPTTHTPANIPFYRAMVESLDTEIGRLFATLGPAVMADTNVIFVADNGSVQRQSVAPFDGTRSKGSPYEGGVNVPLIISGPIVQQPGREVAALACVVDVFSTVLEMAGADADVPPFVKHDSVSLVPYLTDPAAVPIRQFAYTEQFNGTAWPAPLSGGHATVRGARYKLIDRISGADELFDLQVDPWENNNLINNGNAQVVAAKNALRAEIAALRATGGTQSDNFVVFGNSTCPGWNGPPVVAAFGNPAPGGSFVVSLQYGPTWAGLALNALGFSWRQAGSVALPVNLAPFGSHLDCWLSSSAESVLGLTTGILGDAQRSVTLPAIPGLVGVELFSAWVSLDPNAPNNPAQIVSTKSVLIRVQ